MNHKIICLALALSGGLFGCSTDDSHSSGSSQVNTPRAGKEVVVLPGSAPVNRSLDMALPQLGRASVVLTVQQPVTSIKTALEILPEIQKVAKGPVDAVTEYKGWFWYGVGVMTEGSEDKFITNSKSKGEKRLAGFIWGYAVKKGGRDIVYWSMW